MCGRSSLRCRFDGTPTEVENLVNTSGRNDDGGSADNIDFLFGFTGYSYHTITDADVFQTEIMTSIWQ